MIPIFFLDKSIIEIISHKKTPHIAHFDDEEERKKGFYVSLYAIAWKQITSDSYFNMWMNILVTLDDIEPNVVHGDTEMN